MLTNAEKQKENNPDAIQSGLFQGIIMQYHILCLFKNLALQGQVIKMFYTYGFIGQISSFTILTTFVKQT